MGPAPDRTGPPGQEGVKRFLPGSLWRTVLQSQQRERSRLLAEMVQIKGLMPLLMRRRNGMRWNSMERKELRRQLEALAHISPYVAVMILPGSFAVIPILAWWLDRRRVNRRPAQTEGDL